MTDNLDQIRQLRPSSPPEGDQTEALARVRANLITTLEDAPATGAAAATLLNSDASTELACPGPSEDTTSIVDAITGDPVADCQAEWAHETGETPPAMTAYDNGIGGVVVIIDGNRVPSGHTAIGSGLYQNPAVIELEATLADYGRGLNANCYNAADAAQVAQVELDRLGLQDWVIEVDETRRPDGIDTCADAFVHPETTTVELYGHPGVEPGFEPVATFRTFASTLADDLDAACANLEDATALTSDLAAQTHPVTEDGIELPIDEASGALIIHQVEDPTADCTRSAVTIGGRVEVTLRGPVG